MAIIAPILPQTALLGLGLLCTALGVGAAPCELPSRPQLPDGATASMDQMLAGQKAVQAFQASNMVYMKCLEETFTAAKTASRKSSGEAERAQAKARYSESLAAYNAAVSAEEEVAGDFNVELREYKVANK